MRRHFVSGFPRALLSLSQGKSSGVEIEIEDDIYSSRRMPGIIVQVFLQIVAFSLQTDRSGRPVLTKRKRPLDSTTDVGPVLTFHPKPHFTL